MPAATTPADILDIALQQAIQAGNQSLINDPDVTNRIEFICRFVQNRACVRLLLACSLAKATHPEVDIRKPYTEIGTPDCYSGRTYDERYITSFVLKHRLPCNPTTAFLTPAFRNRNATLTPEFDLLGRHPQVYQITLQLFDDVYLDKISANKLLAETIRYLLIIRDEKLLRMNMMLADLKVSGGNIPLSAETIITIVEQHLKCPNASRLPVLAIAAAYQAAIQHLGERVLPLEAHNAADSQTGSLGDIQIALVGENTVITVYEMKTRRVELNDLDFAIQKLNRRIDNYIFITTEEISEQVKDYAATMYARTGGIELVVLDCMSFLRHFLHLFYRLRMQFLEAYQELVLVENESAVRHSLKEAFLALRLAAESANTFDES
jgi:hypothetical protein